MKVRAKFVVQSITRRKHWNAQKGEINSIELSPVVSGSEENKAFFEATPGGMVRLEVVNEDTGRFFEPGKNYYLDFIAAE